MFGLIVGIVLFIALVVCNYYIYKNGSNVFTKKSMIINSVLSALIVLLSGAVQHYVTKALDKIDIKSTELVVSTDSLQTSLPTDDVNIISEHDKILIQQLFSQYVHRFVSAVNYNDMSYFDGLFTDDNTIYDELQSYVEEFCEKIGVREVVVENSISNYIYESENSCLIDTYEKYEITTNESGTRDSEFNAQYRVKKDNGKWYLSDITEEHVPYSY